MTEYLNDPDFLALMGDVSKSSLKTYVYPYRGILDHFQIDTVYELFDENTLEDVEDFLDAMNPNTALGYIKVIKKLFDKDDMPESMNEIDEKFRKKAQDLKKERNKELSMSLVKYPTLSMRLHKETDPLRIVVLYLVLYYNCRNQDLMLEIVYNHKDTLDPNKNYLLVRGSEIVFIRNVYKTAKTYGQKKNSIKAMKFRKAVIELSAGENRYLFSDKHGNMITNHTQLGNIIPKLLPFNYTESQIFKIVVRDIDEKGNLNRLKRASTNRGTSVSTIVDEYHINLNNFKK